MALKAYLLLYSLILISSEYCAFYMEKKDADVIIKNLTMRKLCDLIYLFLIYRIIRGYSVNHFNMIMRLTISVDTSYVQGSEVVPWIRSPISFHQDPALCHHAIETFIQ